MDSSTYYKDNDSSFEVVIVVTIFFSTTIFGLLLCCCCSPGFFDSLDHWINNHNTHTSNAEYGERVLRRIQDQEEREKESPEIRRKKLLTSFANNKVSMVRTASLITYYIIDVFHESIHVITNFTRFLLFITISYRRLFQKVVLCKR